MESYYIYSEGWHSPHPFQEFPQEFPRMRAGSRSGRLLLVKGR